MVIKMISVLLNGLKRRPFLVTWISLLLYIFYDTFEFYRTGRQFRYLRNILGIGLNISRGTATVLNICCALILLPLCKKLNQLLYLTLSKRNPKIFFFWLENAKSFHMTIGATIGVFSVIHSSSHFVNIWNLSHFEDDSNALHFNGYKLYSLISLLLTQPSITGILMLITILGMGASSIRIIRRKFYNIFWYIHQLYVLFLVLLLLHPLSGVLKEEVINVDARHVNISTILTATPVFTPIKSKTLNWMVIPLTCFLIDLFWRLITRNRCKVILQKVESFPGHVINLTMKCENQTFRCRVGQYILLQCLDISQIEWHPFTVVKVPKTSQDGFNVWIRVKGDWTEELERKIKANSEFKSFKLNLLLDGPFSSPMEKVTKSNIAVCIAAGVGITPFVSILQSLFDNPRSRCPGRMHLIWIVRSEEELTWIASLVNNTIIKLINANKPDRLHVLFYITSAKKPNDSIMNNTKEHLVVFHEKDGIKHYTSNNDEEKNNLLTPNLKRTVSINAERLIADQQMYINSSYRIAKQYPLLGCRLRRGRPQWDTLFDYWIHLYPGYHLNLFCCGPKKLSSYLQAKCNEIKGKKDKTKFSFINEGFS